MTIAPVVVSPNHITDFGAHPLDEWQSWQALEGAACQSSGSLPPRQSHLPILRQNRGVLGYAFGYPSSWALAVVITTSISAHSLPVGAARSLAVLTGLVKPNLKQWHHLDLDWADQTPGQNQ